MRSAKEDIELMKKSGIGVYLGGSRGLVERIHLIGTIENYVGELSFGVPEGTDWDYYATYTVALYSALIEVGWQDRVDEESSYLDDEAVSILEKDDHQIVLRKDALFYKAVIEDIDIEFYEKYLWKSHSRRKYSNSNEVMNEIRSIFNMLFRMKRNKYEC